MYCLISVWSVKRLYFAYNKSHETEEKAIEDFLKEFENWSKKNSIEFDKETYNITFDNIVHNIHNIPEIIEKKCDIYIFKISGGNYLNYLHNRTQEEILNIMISKKCDYVTVREPEIFYDIELFKIKDIDLISFNLAEGFFSELIDYNNENYEYIKEDNYKLCEKIYNLI